MLEVPLFNNHVYYHQNKNILLKNIVSLFEIKYKEIG
jgi:hypothetical protein